MDTQCGHKVGTMSAKTAALRIRIEPELHDQFLYCCHDIDRPAAQVLRGFMRDFVKRHNDSSQLDPNFKPDPEQRSK
jgi:hypothetical protein